MQEQIDLTAIIVQSSWVNITFSNFDPSRRYLWIRIWSWTEIANSWQITFPIIMHIFGMFLFQRNLFKKWTVDFIQIYWFLFSEIFRGKKKRLQIQDFLAQLWISTLSNFNKTERRTDRKTKRKNPKRFSLKAYYIKHAISGQKKTWSSFFFITILWNEKKIEKQNRSFFFSAFNLKRLSTKRYFFSIWRKKNKNVKKSS